MGRGARGQNRRKLEAEDFGVGYLGVRRMEPLRRTERGYTGVMKSPLGWTETDN